MNSVMHWQMLTADPKKVAAFYSAVFGWLVSDANGLGYRTVASSADRGIDGGIWPAPSGSPEIVQVFVEVEDVEAILAKICDLGGTVLLPKQVLPDGDIIALALDPLGRSFGLVETGCKRAVYSAEKTEERCCKLCI